MNSKTGVEEQNGTFYDPVKPQAKNFKDLSTQYHLEAIWYY